MCTYDDLNQCGVEPTQAVMVQDVDTLVGQQEFRGQESVMTMSVSWTKRRE